MNEIIESQSFMKVQARNSGGDPGGLEACFFPQKDKSAIFLLIRSIYIHHSLESSETRIISVIFLLFLNLNIIIPSYVLIKNFIVPFLWIRPLPSRIPCCAPEVKGCLSGLLWG